MRDDNLKTPIPHQNPFIKFKFTNVRDYKQNTLVIPENIILQLDKHVEELPEIHKLFYDIFSNTGMRLKEVLFLEEDCIEKTKHENLYQIKYKPYKVLAARRKVGLSDYHRVMVPKTLTDNFQKHIKRTSELRVKENSPFIFICKRYENRTTMFAIRSFIETINDLIKKHEILDENGSLWNFTSRQMRKTTAVTLIENGATAEELTYWLGHLCKDTAAQYYAEVRKMKLAEMNTKFFKEKFDLLLSDEQLQGYSEEERRLLYIDFCLEERRVEFGYCLKKLADGGCSERNILYNCVNCSNLCTGGKYLPYWQELFIQQERVINTLLNIYEKNCINDYLEFREYKKEVFLLQCYENVIDLIKSKEADI